MHGIADLSGGADGRTDTREASSDDVSSGS